MSAVEVYSSGLVCCSVCAPDDMHIEDVEAQVNRVNPTFIDSKWRLSEEERFRDGQPNPCPCEATPGRLHYLLNC